ncbi:MAG: GIY-YIG nuclease family protein [Campylobacterales bacterium]|nr:GIY-YIG nuclease family protein [Campylobacterales bacterium]
MAEINSLDDILNNDEFGLLNTENEEDIHTLKNVSKKNENTPDYVARREVCEDFEKYEYLFIQVQKELNNGKRKLHSFRSEKDIKVGFYFVLNGVVGCIVDVAKEKTKSKSRNYNRRLKIIFENGTESNMLLRSLSSSLYTDGKIITENEDKLLDGLSQINKDDTQNGFIYILESLSTEDVILTKKNLYKIGFSTTSVETRIKNAKEDPTYLMADVQTVAAYEVYNVNPHKLEQLIHKFFGNSCLDIEIYDGNGKLYKPREWFIAPLNVIEEAIELIISGEIINYKYNDLDERIANK